MEFERVPLPGWNWAVWSERQAAASSPSPRWRRRQQVDEPESTVHGSWRPASEFETADGRSELDAAAAARRRRQRRRYERAKQQPSGPGPPGSTAAATAGTVTATVPCTDATVHVSWQRRRRWKFRLSATGLDERRPGQQPWRQWWWWWWNAEQQQQQRWRQQQQRIQQYATKLCSSVGWRWDESSSISWIKLFANAVGW